MRRGKLVPTNYPMLDGHCAYCFTTVPADDDHAERWFGSCWRLRCEQCHAKGCNPTDQLIELVRRALPRL
jgi:hypothetical protein